MIKEKVISGLRWTAGMRITSQVLTWAMTLVVIRLLSPADYGLLAMATVVIAFLSLLSEIGLGPAIVQKSVIEPGVLNKVFGLVLAFNLAICIALSLAAPLIAAFYQEDRLVRIIQVMSFQFVVSAFAVVPEAMLQREMEFRKRSLVDLSGSVLGGLTTLGLALSGFGVWSLVAGTFASQIWKAIGLNVILRAMHRPVFSFSGLREYVVFGGHISLSGILWFFYTQADVLIAGKWLGKEALGYYAVAMHLASLFNQRIAGIINQVAFPAFSLIQNDLKKVGDKVLLGARVLSFVSFPCLWGISAVAPETILLVLGPKWESAILPLSMIALIMPLRVIGHFVPNAVQGIGRADVILRNVAWACVIMPAAFAIGVNWGLLGLSVAWLAGAPLVFLNNGFSSMRVMGLRLTDLLKSLLPSAAAGLVMYASVAITRLWIGFDSTSVGSLPILILAGAASYGVASLLLNRKGCVEVVSILKEMVNLKRERISQEASRR